jgi:hypothetical protein
MQRDNGSYFQDKLNWWFVAGQFYYYTDPIHGLAVTFAPVLYDIIDFLYNEESNSFYDMLNKNEKEIVIPGIIQENKKEESINIEKKYKEALLEYDWDTVLLYIIKHKNSFMNIPSDIKFFLNFKSILLDQREIISNTFTKEQIVDKNKINTTLDALSEYNITKTHWISRVFKNHYKGSCHDILFSPLFTLVNIGSDISRHIKTISDILFAMDSLPNETQRSILVMLKERVRTFDEIGYIALQELTHKSTDNKVYRINKTLIEKGIPPKHRYILNDSIYWMCTKGCLKNTYKIYNEAEHVLGIFHTWQPFGVKLLLDYPFN